MSDPLLLRVLADLTADAVGPRCLVTGGRGEVGRRLVEALVALGCSVVVVDTARAPREPTPGVTHLRADVCDRRAMDGLFAAHGLDTVFHCAAVVSDQGLMPRAAEQHLMRVNVVGTATVLDRAGRAGVGRFVFVSTHRLTPGGPEDRSVASVSSGPGVSDAYTRSKQHAERAVLAAHGIFGMRTIVLRTSVIWSIEGRLVAGFLRTLISGRFTRWIGQPGDVLHRTHRDTLVRALVLGAAALGRDAATVGGQAYAITDDERAGPMEWFAPIARSLGYPLPRRRVAVRWLRPVALFMEVIHCLGGAPARWTRPYLDTISGGVQPSVDRARLDLGWSPVVSQAEGVALGAAGLHRMHARIRADLVSPSLPFRSPDAAFFDETPRKLVFIVWDRARVDRRQRRARLVDAVGTALQRALSPQTLSIDVDGPDSRVRSPSPFPLGARAVAGLVNLRTVARDAPAVVERILSEHGFDGAGYRVEESVFRDYGDNAHSGPRDWPDGVQSPGVVAVTFFEKPSRLAYDRWMDAWHGGISLVSEAIQPRTRYVRNRVIEPITAGAPPIAGIVEECFPTADHVRDPRKFYGSSSVPGLIGNMARILWTVTRFLNVTRIQTTVMSETVIRSGWTGPAEEESRG